MTEAEIHIKDNQERFFAGDTVSGTVELVLPKAVPLSAVSVSFHCMGEVKWVEYPASPYYLDGTIYYDDYTYLEEVLNVAEAGARVEAHLDHQKATIPFAFHIPDDKNLPSTMVSNHGFIQYYVRVLIKHGDKEDFKQVKRVVVQSPIKENLLITVGGSAEKNVLLHGGPVNLYASIGQKGFAPGDSIPVHLSVDNRSNARLVPRLSLHQVQIFMCGVRHKTIDNPQNEEPVVGKEIPPNSEVDEVVNVPIPKLESLSIKSSVITVKYFVRVTLDIPHSFDLHLNLPIVLTAKRALDELQDAAASKPNLLTYQAVGN